LAAARGQGCAGAAEVAVDALTTAAATAYPEPIRASFGFRRGLQMLFRLTPIFVLLSATALAAQPVPADHAAKMARGLDLFKRHVRPVFVEQCLKCHGGKNTEAGFDLSDRGPLLKGGDAGPAVVIGQGKDSLLVKLLRHAKDPKMPKGGAKLPT